MWVRRNVTAILLLLLAGGFAMVAAELLITAHTEGVQLVGVVASVAGLIVVLLGLIAKGTFRMVLVVVLLLLSVSGLTGAYQHFEAASGREASISTPVVQGADAVNLAISYSPTGDVRSVVPQESGEQGEANERRDRGGGASPPPLAPLSLSGLALMGAVVLLSKVDDKQGAEA